MNYIANLCNILIKKYEKVIIYADGCIYVFSLWR